MFTLPEIRYIYSKAVYRPPELAGAREYPTDDVTVDGLPISGIKWQRSWNNRRPGRFELRRSLSEHAGRRTRLRNTENRQIRKELFRDRHHEFIEREKRIQAWRTAADWIQKRDYEAR